jgi:hypothetical protein
MQGGSHEGSRAKPVDEGGRALIWSTLSKACAISGLGPVPPKLILQQAGPLPGSRRPAGPAHSGRQLVTPSGPRPIARRTMASTCILAQSTSGKSAVYSISRQPPALSIWPRCCRSAVPRERVSPVTHGGHVSDEFRGRRAGGLSNARSNQESLAGLGQADAASYAGRAPRRRVPGVRGPPG